MTVIVNRCDYRTERRYRRSRRSAPRVAALVAVLLDIAVNDRHSGVKSCRRAGFAVPVEGRGCRMREDRCDSAERLDRIAGGITSCCLAGRAKALRTWRDGDRGAAPATSTFLRGGIRGARRPAAGRSARRSPAERSIDSFGSGLERERGPRSRSRVEGRKWRSFNLAAVNRLRLRHPTPAGPGPIRLVPWPQLTIRLCRQAVLRFVERPGILT